ncbi:Exocyst complex component S3A [Ranunculus cassubicifolius]
MKGCTRNLNEKSNKNRVSRSRSYNTNALRSKGLEKHLYYEGPSSIESQVYRANKIYFLLYRSSVLLISFDPNGFLVTSRIKPTILSFSISSFTASRKWGAIFPLFWTLGAFVCLDLITSDFPNSSVWAWKLHHLMKCPLGTNLFQPPFGPTVMDRVYDVLLFSTLIFVSRLLKSISFDCLNLVWHQLKSYVMGISEAEAFSERLKRELLALEAANVHAILETEPLIDEVLQGLESASICVEDMDEWLCIFNVKLRHMREDIESIETRNNKLEMQSYNNRALTEELDKLLLHLRIPPELSTYLTDGSFDEAHMPRIIDSCEWISAAMLKLQVPNFDPAYSNIRGVKEKQAELKIIKSTFTRRASEFLRNYFANLVDFMINDKSYFSQRRQLKRPDHADLRYKCRTYARLLQHLKVLDKSCLDPLRKAYCHSLNLLLRREAREFANELRTSTKVSRTPIVWLEGSTGPGVTLNNADTSMVSDAYGKMLTVFIPLLVDDFYAVIDWGFKLDPLRCISLHGLTERYLSTQKADAAGIVRLLLNDLESRISMLFNRFVDEACHQIEKYERNARQMGVLPYIPRFATLATRMEQYIQGHNLVDQAYTKFVSIMFVTLEKVAQADPKYADIMIFENYAAFQNSLYDLANVVPTLAKFFHQASEAFERLFGFARKIEELMYTMNPEEIPYQIGFSKMELRKTLKASLSGVDKSISFMYRKLQKNLTSEELLPSLWEKCKKEFLEKYETFLKLVAKIYPSESLPSVVEMRDALAAM